MDEYTPAEFVPCCFLPHAEVTLFAGKTVIFSNTGERICDCVERKRIYKRALASLRHAL